MSDIKMSDVFNKLEYKNGRDIDTGELVDVNGNWWATFNSKQAAMHASKAINSYDQKQELIAKQAADIKMLREALSKQRRWSLNLVVLEIVPKRYYESVEVEVDDIDCVLAATKIRNNKMNKQELMMKAVCKYKGVFPEEYNELITTSEHWAGGNQFIGDIEPKDNSYIIGRDRWVELCTAEEFNNLVDELSRAEWIPEKLNVFEKINDDFNKGMLECCQKISQLIGCKFGVDIGYNNLPDAVDCALNGDTSAEWNGDRLPPVGIKCMATHGGESEACEIIHYHKDEVCVIWDKLNNGGMGILITKHWKFEPILTPEQKEAKEREDTVNKIMECNFLRTCNHQTTKDVVRALYDAGLLKTEV